MNFDQSFAQLMHFEGGYSDNAADNGGKTNHGITEAVARQNGYTSDMRDLPIELAKAIYKRMYWDKCRCDDLPSAIRYDLFDAAVNSGPSQAVKWLQRTVGVSDDGMLGPVTLAACNATAHLNSKFNGQRLLFMTTLPSWSVFGKGWARRIADNLIRGIE